MFTRLTFRLRKEANENSRVPTRCGMPSQHGEKTIAATTHIVEDTVDQGPILMISPPLPVIVKKEWDLSNPEHLKEAESFNQERLKENGDWLIFPKTIEYLAQGRYGRDETGTLYFDGKPIPYGFRYEI